MSGKWIVVEGMRLRVECIESYDTNRFNAGYTATTTVIMKSGTQHVFRGGTTAQDIDQMLGEYIA